MFDFQTSNDLDLLLWVAESKRFPATATADNVLLLEPAHATCSTEVEEKTKQNRYASVPCMFAFVQLEEDIPALRWKRLA